MATRGALRTETRNLLDDNASTKRWTDAELDGYLNDAQMEFSSITRCFIRKVTITLSANVSEYPVYDGTIRGIVGMPDTVYFTYSSTTRVLYPTTEKILDSSVGPMWRSEVFAPGANQTPIQYYMTPALADGVTPNVLNIGIYRKPSTSAGSIVISAPAIPVEIATGSGNDSTSPGIPLQYHEALPYGAAYRALLRNQDAQSLSLGTAYKARYMEFAEVASKALGRA